MMHTPMVCAINELFHNAKTNIDNQPVGKVGSQKQECDLRQPQELSSKLQSTMSRGNMGSFKATTNKQIWILNTLYQQKNAPISINFNQ